MEWDASSLVDLMIANKPISEETCNNNRPDEPSVSDTVAEQEKNGAMQNAWPIIDLSKLNLNLMNNRKRDKQLPYLVDRDEKQHENNNMNNPDKADKEDWENESKNYERMKKFPSFRKTERSSARKSPIIGESNVVWPGVLLNYNNNFDVAGMSARLK